MTENHGTIGGRPDSASVGTPMCHRVTHGGKQMRAKRTRTASVPDYAAHLVGPDVRRLLSRCGADLDITSCLLPAASFRLFTICTIYWLPKHRRQMRPPPA